MLCFSLAGVFAHAAGPAAGPSSLTGVRLTSISARAHDKGASLVIEASEPVPYVATSPDPMTLLVDFRNVAADDVANSVAADARGVRSPGGGRIRPIRSARPPRACASRWRSRLAHHVRSDRNTVIVDFEKRVRRAPHRTCCRRRRGTPLARSPALDGPKSPAADPIAALGLDGAGVKAAAAASAEARRGAGPDEAGRARAGAAPGDAAPDDAAAGRAAGGRRATLHRSSGQPRLPGRRSARRAAHVRRDQRPEHRHRSRPCRARWTSRCATCRGTRRSTSSCARTSSATSWTARSSAIAPLDRAGRRVKERSDAGECAGRRGRARTR